jgi:hypothetical protein
MSSRIKIIVARYREQIDWLHDLKDLCIVYNKGPDDIPSNFKCHKLDNFGREADTYLKYIVANYPNFPDYVVFTQADIHDHVSSLDLFKGLVRHIDGVPGSGVPGSGVPGSGVPGYIGLTDMGVDHGWGTVRNFIDPVHAGLPIRDLWFMLYENPPLDNMFHCNYCGVFMVSKENILYHSKTFYEKLIEYQKTHAQISPYVLERLWTTIFNGKTKSRFDTISMSASDFVKYLNNENGHNNLYFQVPM